MLWNSQVDFTGQPVPISTSTCVSNVYRLTHKLGTWRCAPACACGACPRSACTCTRVRMPVRARARAHAVRARPRAVRAHARACTCGASSACACTCSACTCGACTCGACTCGACMRAKTMRSVSNSIQVCTKIAKFRSILTGIWPNYSRIYEGPENRAHTHVQVRMTQKQSQKCRQQRYQAASALHRQPF